MFQLVSPSPPFRLCKLLKLVVWECSAAGEFLSRSRISRALTMRSNIWPPASLTIIKAVFACVNIFSTGGYWYSWAFNACRNADSRFWEVKAHRTKFYAFAKVDTRKWFCLKEENNFTSKRTIAEFTGREAPACLAGWMWKGTALSSRRSDQHCQIR